MTRSKLELAKILVGLRKDGSDPEKLAQEMTLRRLCFEIEKIEGEEPLETPKKPLETPKKESRPFWAFLTHDSSDDE
jgi:hypothetical protein